MVQLRTTGGGRVRFNPNLYACGKVCLSLLGTWQAGQGESWSADASTTFQVLISIQSLILVDEPYFNGELVGGGLCWGFVVVGVGMVDWKRGETGGGEKERSAVATSKKNPRREPQTPNTPNNNRDSPSLLLPSPPLPPAEPGYERTMHTQAGRDKSASYNRPLREETVRLAMLDVLRHPPAEWAEVVRTHFKLR